MRNRRRGSTLLEFTLTGLPVMFLSLSVVECGLSMFEYNSMANAVTVAARYASNHGATCQSPNACTIKVSDVANLIANTAWILDTSKLNVVLTANGVATNCKPLNTCQTNASPSTNQFPASGDNAVNMDITITATYKGTNPMPMFWPPNADVDDSGYTLGAQSRQRIQF